MNLYFPDAWMEQAGWDVEADGMCGAPEVAVVVGEEAHSTLFKALGWWGLVATMWCASRWTSRPHAR